MCVYSVTNSSECTSVFSGEVRLTFIRREGWVLAEEAFSEDTQHISLLLTPSCWGEGKGPGGRPYWSTYAEK